MRHFSTYISAAGFIAVCIALAWWDAPMAYLAMLLTGMDVLSYAIYVLILILAVVFVPLTAMPAVPMAVSVLGPLPTALLSIVGWTIGAVLAFLIARHIGQPFLKRLIPLESLQKRTSTIPPNTHFFIIVLLHLTLPVDIVSYSVGLTSTISPYRYAAAACIGVTWFAFGFAYLGNALTTGNMPLLIAVGGACTIMFISAVILLKRQQNKD